MFGANLGSLSYGDVLVMYYGFSFHDIETVPCLCLLLTAPGKLYPLTSHFYIVKLGFTGVHTFSYICEAVLTCTHDLCFEQK